jgi:hypothetical protein
MRALLWLTAVRLKVLESFQRRNGGSAPFYFADKNSVIANKINPFQRIEKMQREPCLWP